MDVTYLRFRKNSPEAQELISWWESLNVDRGERAALRRCHSLPEVTFSPAYHRLRKSLMKFGRIDDDRLPLVVGLSARVKTNVEDSSISYQMATGKADGSARVSGLRFRRLLKVQEREELFASMIRVISLLGGAVNLQSLAESLYFWNDITRKNWAFEYYSKAPDEM